MNSEITSIFKNILIIDDMPENLRLLSDLLSKQGYKVRQVRNGATALKACQAKPPDLILLDIHMPEMDGYEVCEKLKADDFTREIPVIFLSARDETLDKVKAFTIGGADYITKPFQLKEVLARVENQLRLSDTQKLLEEQNARLQEQNVLLEQEIRDRQFAQAALESSEAKNRSLLSAIPDLMFCVSADGIFLDYREAKDNLRSVAIQTLERENLIRDGKQADNFSLTNAQSLLMKQCPKGMTPERGSRDRILNSAYPVPDSRISEHHFIGKKIFEVLSDDLAVWTMHYVEQTLLTNEIQIAEYVQQINRKWHHYEARFVTSGSNEVLAIVRDISERKQADAERLQSEALLRTQTQRLEQALNDLKHAQTQLIQNEKMVSLGQLVAGITHEINNPVSFIYGNITYASGYVQELLNLIEVYQQEYPKPTPKVQEVAEEIDLNFLKKDVQKLMGSMEMGVQRIRQIVLSLGNFSRLDQAQMKRVNIHEGIDSTLLILQHRLRKAEGRPAIEVIKEYGELPKVICYASQLNQVFFHILNNAIDALEEGARRRDSSIENPQIRISTELTASGTIKIRIKDNGVGIAESARSRLFDPFFTTKPVGSGTGLGLSITYQIVVQKHKGLLTCCSSPGQGAEFAIEIPLHQPEPSSAIRE